MWAQLKTFELGLDYRRTMLRVQLNVIPESGLGTEEWHQLIRSYHSMWWTFLKTHTQQQYTNDDHTQWPLNLPWPARAVCDMPVVIWLTKSAT